MTKLDKAYRLIPIIIAGLFVLAGYNFIRSIAVPTFIDNYGKDRIPEATVVMGLVLVGFMFLHGKSLSILGAAKTCFLVHLGSIVLFIVCLMGLKNHISPFAYALYILKDIYIVVLIEHYWSFFNSTFDQPSGKKLAGLYTGLVSIGPIISGYFVSYQTPKMSDPLNWILYTSFTVAPALVAMLWAYSKYPVTKDQEKNQSKTSEFEGWKSLKQYPQLRIIALFVIITQVISASTTFALNCKVAEVFPEVAAQTTYYGSYYSNINIIAGFFQFLVAPILLHYVSAMSVFVALALFQLFFNLFALQTDSLFNIMLASLMFKSFDYSLYRCAKELFYIPLNFNARYHAKHLIDVVFYRASNSGISVIFTIGKSLGSMNDLFYTSTAALASIVWLGFALIKRKKLNAPNAVTV